MTLVKSLKQLLQDLSPAAKAKLDRDFESAKADPRMQELVDSLNTSALESQRRQDEHKEVKLLNPLFEALSDKAKAKAARDFESAKADPRMQELVDSLNRSALASQKRQDEKNNG